MNYRRRHIEAKIAKLAHFERLRMRMRLDLPDDVQPAAFASYLRTDVE